jgi:hypothetical protein
MQNGLDRILTLSFGAGGNETNHLGNGWSGEEPGSRWMVGQGSEIWLEHPGAGHDLILDLDIGTMQLPEGSKAQRLVVGARNRGVAQIAVAHGGTIGFHIPAALIAAPGPIRLLFIHPDFRRPADIGVGTDDRQLAFSVKSLRVFRVLPRPVIATGPPALPRDQLITLFESLGDNCEFGLVQRKMGAEPLGLLRFSFIELRDLLRGMQCGFDGLGDPGTVDVTAQGADREIVVRESVYNMTYHTFQYETEIDLETVQRQQATRLNFLKRKLMEDIGAGEKIFVLKRFPALRPEEVLPIYATLNELGRNWLLWMVPSDAAHSPGTIEVLLPGLLRGYIDRFAPNENAHNLSLETWTAVCEAAWRAVGGALRAQ